MFIKNYGLFWRADEINWNPGSGQKNEFRLLGRRGKIQPKLRLCDFRYQQGIYILYGNYGPYYVGLTMANERGIGQRLKEHLNDDHEGYWDRFSWFGFRDVLKGTESGICKLKKLAGLAVGQPTHVIRDVEALLIRSMSLMNVNHNNFYSAEEWFQVKKDEVEKYVSRSDRSK